MIHPTVSVLGPSEVMILGIEHGDDLSLKYLRFRPQFFEDHKFLRQRKSCKPMLFKQNTSWHEACKKSRIPQEELK